jgi:hypothetical protein
MLNALDIESHYPFYMLRRAYAHGDIDGTLLELEEVVSGGKHVDGFGGRSRFRLAVVLIKWYKGAE